MQMLVIRILSCPERVDTVRGLNVHGRNTDSICHNSTITTFLAHFTLWLEDGIDLALFYSSFHSFLSHKDLYYLFETTLIDFFILDQLCIPMLNLTYLYYIILISNCCIPFANHLLRIFICMLISVLSSTFHILSLSDIGVSMTLATQNELG